MSKLVVVNHVTLDGVMQAPALPDEDPRGGFTHGGWAMPRNDEVLGRFMGEHMAASAGGALLLGRRTYENFFSYWPNQTDNPYTEVLNKTQKYVVSTTLTEPLPWVNSTLISDVGREVAALKHNGQDLTVLGSGDLIHTLMRHNLIDEYLLMIHPVVLGSGRRLFPDSGPYTDLRLVDSLTTTTGVIIATYQPAGQTT